MLADAFRKENPDAFDELVEVERERFQRAPVIVAVISRVTPGHKIPEWGADAVEPGRPCMNMLNAAHAIGYSAQWLDRVAGL